MTALARGLAERLRRFADRIDYAGAPKAVGWSFTFERGVGIRFRSDGKGCPLWYRCDSDYDRAHLEADRPGPWVDWATGTCRRRPSVSPPSQA